MCAKYFQFFTLVYHKQGGRGWLAFGDRSRISQSFRRAHIFKLLRQKHCLFLLLWEHRQVVVVKAFKHIKTHSLKHPFICLDTYFFFTKLLFYESSLKALQKLSVGSPKAPRKQALWKLSESSLKALRKHALQSSTKALRKLSQNSLKNLWNQSEFCWKPFKSKLTFVESTPKAGWLS